MSYRILTQDPRIKCGLSDAEFDAQVTAEHLADYAIDVTTGHRGDCGREKAEQFKRLHPDKMVIAYENPAADDPRTWPGGTWAGYYLMMNRTSAVGAVNAQQASIPVANPKVFSVGDTAVMWSPTGIDPYANSEWVSVKAISGSTLTVKRDMFATGAQSYSQAPLIAAAATGPTYPDPNFNFSDVAPVNPANGERAIEWMANNEINDFAPSTADAPTLDAVEFDTAGWTPPTQNDNGTVKNLDCNGDGRIDYCNRDVGSGAQVNSYGVGYDEFVQLVKVGLTAYDTDLSRPPKMVLADGESGLRSLGSANGAEFESFPAWDNYAYSSAALDTLDTWQNHDTALGPHLSYAFTKDVTRAYPQASSNNPRGCVTPLQGGTCRNGEFRYGMAAALMWGGASTYNNEASFTYAQPWDEEATVDQSTTGLSPGYLGQPLGPAIRSKRYASGDFVVNSSFESGISGTSLSTVIAGAISAAQDTATAAPGAGSSSLRADVTSQTPDPTLSDARVNVDATGPVTTGEYTVDFWARAVNTSAGPQAMNIGVGLSGVVGGPEVILATNTWVHHFLMFEASTTATKPVVKFFLGTQLGSYWIDAVHLHRGTAGILTREFTNGIVVLNDSFADRNNIALPDGPYHHINGKQDRTVNDGTSVGSLLPVIAAKDGEILLRG